jgi:electron transport complex protein RnfC
LCPQHPIIATNWRVYAAETALPFVPFNYCDLVCPSHIPLTADFRKAKGRIRELADEKARAARARRRFEARNERLQREQQEREDELARQKESAKSAGPAAIAEILQRKQNKKKDDPS